MIYATIILITLLLGVCAVAPFFKNDTANHKKIK